MDYFVFVILPTGLIGCAAAYLTSLGCRFARWRHHRPTWLIAPVADLTTAFGVITIIYLGTSLQPGSWGKFPLADIAPEIFVRAAIVALLAALVVVLLHRRADSGC